MVLLTATSLKNLSQNGKFLLDTVNQNPFVTLTLYYTMKGIPNLFCGIFAVGRNHNLTRDNKVHKPYLAKFDKNGNKGENMSKKHKHISATKTTEQKEVQQSQQPQKLTLQKLNRLLEKNPFAQLLGMELLEVREGYAYGRMRMDEHFTNIYGGMHGGCSYALADTLAGVAASTYGNYVTTIDGKMNYLEAVKDTGYVYGEAEVQRQGGRIGVYTVKLMDENQRVLVTADFTYYRTGQAIDQQG